MNQAQWNALTDAEKFTHLTTGRVEIKTRHGVDGSSRVSDVKMITVYSVIMNGVTLGESQSVQTALRDTADFLDSLTSGDER